MNYQIIILLFLLSFGSNLQSQDDSTKMLNLRSIYPIKQLETAENNRFDLSGIVQYKDTVYVIADKAWNNHIYKIDTSSTSFTVSSAIKLCPEDKIDFEGIDVCKDKFYLIEEWYNDVFEADLASCSLKKLAISWDEQKTNRTKWGNKGLEGIAYDCENKILYLAKERGARKIFKVDLNSNLITQPFADFIDSDKQGFDIADMKYQKGALYILERGRGLITKIDCQSNTKYSVSFQHVVFKNGQRLYKNKNPEYGMAEALLLTENEIWIGLDNNGDRVSKYGKSLGLKGNRPVILIFTRPEGF